MSKFPLRSLLSQCVDRLTVLVSRFRFGGSGAYWEARYRMRGSSGAGSYGEIALRKAEFLNAFCREYDIDDVLEFGCGDGAQLALATYKQYTGIDVSRTAIGRCRERFAADSSRRFVHLDDFRNDTADLALSLDVLYHLVEDAVFEAHLDALFASARRFVVIFSTNHDDPADRAATHVRHRAFTDLCTKRFPDYELLRRPGRESSPDHVVAGFYVFRRRRSNV